MPKPKKINQYKKQRKRNRLLVLSLVLISLFFLFALMRIGVGEAEWAGMTVSDITSTLRVEYNIPEDEQGVLVHWVEEQGYYSGVKEGDLLKSINNKKVRNIREFLNVAKTIDIETGVLLDVLRDRQPLYITLKDKKGLHGQIKEMFNLSTHKADHHSNVKNMQQVAMTAPVPKYSVMLLIPKQQGASKKILVEGHWVGLELIPLTPELATEYRVPPDTKGLLVDEISLESAESGILAGDMLVAIEGMQTPDLVAFTEATRRVKNKKSAEMLVSRRGQLLKLTMSSQSSLGFSQNEAAQTILPGAISPHRSRNKPCTACHIIMRTGGQLPTDAGDILPNPPPITKNAVAQHPYRGKCKNCHIILRK